MNYAPPPQPKKGMSPVAIVLIVLGVLVLLTLGTCAAGALWFGHEVKEVAKNMAEGGLVLVSPPEVVNDLAGRKKDYVGNWTSATGRSTLDIAANGQLLMELGETAGHEKFNAPIAAFIGDDMDLKVGIELRIKVTEAPKKTGTKWEMVAHGVTWHREGA